MSTTLRVPRRLPTAAAAALLCLQLAGCWGDDDDDRVNRLPQNTTSVSRTEYLAATPGTGATAATQDLLTGGLGAAGLAAAAPAYASASAPTAAELRRNSLHANYRGLVDVSANGGYGTLYGPTVPLSGGAVANPAGMVPGVEYVGVLDNAQGTKRVTMAVQVPSSFNQNDPCIVVAPSSGSRGVYGAIGTAGEWGLKRGCAVALTDAGKGFGLHDLSDDTVTHIDGTRGVRSATDATAPITAKSANFVAQITDAARTAFNAAFPNRVAIKHAHSQQNPEKDWGSDTLVAARYALWVLNQEYAPLVTGSTTERERRYSAANTLVIAASVSNGGTAAVRAAELDTEGLIDAVVAGEPGAVPAQSTSTYGIAENGTARAAGTYGKPLMDYFSFANLYQGCAALAAPSTGATHNLIGNSTVLTALATNRCEALARNGLVTGTTPAERSADALNRMRAYGWTVDADTLHSSHFGLGATTQVASMYANAYGRFPVTDNLCGISFGAVNATFDPAPLNADTKAAIFAVGNGVANGSATGLTPAVIINDATGGGGKLWNAAVSRSTGLADLGFDAAVCLRALVTGTNPITGAALGASATAATPPTATAFGTPALPSLAQARSVQAGIAETLASARLGNKPTLVVAGRNDTLLPLNNASRAYVAANRANQGLASPLRYIEVTNAQHFDAFLGFPGYDTRYVPLHYYFVRALDAMYANLKSGTALPPSQVVRTTQRGGEPGAANPITAANVPLFVATPAVGNAITFSGNAVNVPN
ncbi:D-(-)-3-hydroxybutyrate oligomer hydrolase [Azohydromonas aeria]|uniref:D-(-)-3-hydroxybutyrate oligomer hydrolase n=1 Tax=Azohydromonas aeria TaxID=2590212 RepID=UPI001E47F500|nr:D-(-)-3-hydroxybutyrate oligomer hydrolase [Azohydromonas aeria]